MAYSVDPDQTAPIGAVCSGSTLFASIPYLSVMFGNYLQQTTSAADAFFSWSFNGQFIFFGLFVVSSIYVLCQPILKTIFDFQQYGILTSVFSEELVQPPVKLRNYNWCSVSS